MPAMKRPAASPQVSPPKKAAKPAKPIEQASVIDPFAERCDIVSAALQAGGAGNPANMLTAMLPHAAAAPPRHKYQEELLDLVQRELDAQLVAMKNELTNFQTVVSNADGEREKRSAAVGAATADVEAKTAAHSAAKAAETSASNETKAAREGLAAARVEQKEGDCELIAAEEKMSILTSCMEEKGALEKAEGSAEDLTPRAEQLCKNLGKMLEDAGLLKAATQAFSKAVADRKVFDQMVVTQLSEEMNKALANCHNVIADGAPQKTARNAKVQGCENTLNALVERECAAQIAEGDANVAKHEAQAALKAANSAAGSLSVEVEAAVTEIQRVELRLSEFQSGVLQAFADLRDPARVAAAEAAAAAVRAAARDAELDAEVARLNAEAAVAAEAAAAREAEVEAEVARKNAEAAAAETAREEAAAVAEADPANAEVTVVTAEAAANQAVVAEPAAAAAP